MLICYYVTLFYTYFYEIYSYAFIQLTFIKLFLNALFNFGFTTERTSGLGAQAILSKISYTHFIFSPNVFMQCN